MIVQILKLLKCKLKQMFYYFLIVCLFLLVYMWIMQDILKFLDNISSTFSISKRRTMKMNGTKYILFWNGHNLLMDGDGGQVYSGVQCPDDCIFTSDRNFINNDYTNFDAIVFCEGQLESAKNRPKKRLGSQTYIFSTMESSANHPACALYNDGFFNLTFTYRIDSDIPWNYFAIRNQMGDIVAPSVNVTWNTSLDPVEQEIKSVLSKKSKAAAWLVSHCETDSLRDQYISILQEHLYHFSLKIDVYGYCSKRACTHNNCEEMVKKDYYFYMAMENSLSEDYVTEKVLHGIQNYAVPIVYGGANYSRFLPPGSYINAREIHPYNLAFVIYQAIKNPDEYEKYFQWTNLYKADDLKPSSPDHPLCKLCRGLHTDKYASCPAKTDFRLWWNGRNGMKWCLPIEYWNETAKVNVDASHVFNFY